MNRIAAIAGLLVAAPMAAYAQQARVGRLPLLAAPAAGATCSSTPASAALQRSGVARILDIREPSRPRLLSLGVTAAGKANMLMVMMSTHEIERRGEGESVTVFFGMDGTIARGERSAYTTGTPARRSEDQHRLPLLPTDSTQARDMVRAMLELCRG